MISSTPNRPNRVNNIFSLKVTTGSNDCFSSWKPFRPFCSSYFFAFFKNSRSTSPVYCPIHASTTHQRGVCRVDYGICFNISYIPFDELQNCLSNLKAHECHQPSPRYITVLMADHKAELKKYAPKPMKTATQKIVIP